MDEFALIERLFRPLAAGFEGSLGLQDDAALIRVPEGQELVVTTDAICEDIHFFGHEDPALIAQKLLRVNLSDLAAKGAAPLAYFLAVMLPSPLNADWVTRFAQGLAEDQERFGIPLAGGDTTATSGAMSFCVTALGTVQAGAMIRRGGATPGDRIYVSGTLGDSALGLRILCHPEAQPKDDYLTRRYLLPEPRLALGQRLIGLATACIDISDGLAQDLGHICRASGAGATIRLHALPLSAPARKSVEADAALWECVYAGGDDYELLFTMPANRQAAVAALAEEMKIPLTTIGEMTSGNGVDLLDDKGKAIPLSKKGFKHF